MTSNVGLERWLIRRESMNLEEQEWQESKERRAAARAAIRAEAALMDAKDAAYRSWYKSLVFDGRGIRTEVAFMAGWDAAIRMRSNAELRGDGQAQLDRSPA